MTEIDIVVEADGCSRHLVDDFDDIYEALGEPVSTWRNSHVETWNDLSYAAQLSLRKAGFANRDLDLNAWWADCIPVGGPVLGPFKTHKEALRAEVIWLKEHNLPLQVRR